MDTSNKVHVVPQNVRLLKKINSGGVRDPSDPNHYPTLGGTSGAFSNVGPADRRFLPTRSFKDSLMSLPALDKLQGQWASGSMTSMPSVPEEQRLVKPDQGVIPASSSPRIMAESLAITRDGAGTAEPDLKTGPSQQGAAKQNNVEDGFVPLSPRKVVTQAALRRRTADEQAGRAAFYRQLANGNSFTPLAEDASHSSPEVENKDLEEGTHEKVAGTSGGPEGLLGRAYYAAGAVYGIALGLRTLWSSHSTTL